MFFKNKISSDSDSNLDKNPASSQLDDLKIKIRQTDLPAHAASQANSEFEKLQNTDSGAAEYFIGLNYIEFLLSLPWFKSSVDNLDINRTKNILETHHYGLDHVKSRILEFLAAKTLKNQEKAKILVVDDLEVRRVDGEAGTSVMGANGMMMSAGGKSARLSMEFEYYIWDNTEDEVWNDMCCYAVIFVATSSHHSLRTFSL